MNMMRAAFVDKASRTAKVVIREDVPKPTPGPGEVLIKNQCVALNWADVMVVRGEYPGQVPTENFVPGAELMGTVEELGEGVDHLEIGQRIAGVCYPVVGAFAEYSVLEAGRAVPMPDSIPYDTATVSSGVGITAYQLLFTAHNLQAGQTVFIHDISGGVGLAATQLAVDAGATVIGTVATKEKAEVAYEFGATKVISRDQEDFVEATKAFTNDKGVDLLIDPYGGSILSRSIDIMATMGKIINININNSGDEQQTLNLDEVMFKLYERSTSIQCFDVFHIAPAGSENWNRASKHIIERLCDGRLRSLIAEEFEFEQVQNMFDTLIKGEINGKLLLKI